jgi:hypothetical protein
MTINGADEGDRDSHLLMRAILWLNRLARNRASSPARPILRRAVGRLMQASASRPSAA